MEFQQDMVVPAAFEIVVFYEAFHVSQVDTNEMDRMWSVQQREGED